jgi:hypothetical protein
MQYWQVDSPAELTVCMILFSRIEDRPQYFSAVMERTAMGIEALKFRPTSSAIWTVTRPKTIPRKEPGRTARSVNSEGPGLLCSFFANS